MRFLLALVAAVVLSSHACLAQTTWNPSDTAANVALSGGNLVATHNNTSNQNDGTRSTTQYYKGKLYFELTVTANNALNEWHGGLADLKAGIVNQYIGQNIESIACEPGGHWQYNGSNVGSCAVSTFTTGAVVEIAVDLNHNLIWSHVSTDAANTWNGSASNDPATGVGGVALTIGGGYNELYIGWSGDTAAGVPTSATLNPGPSSFTGTVPTGYTAWGTGGAALPGAQTTWNPSDATSAILTFSDANLRADGVASSNFTALVRATSSYAGGRVYFELPIFAYGAANWEGGLANSTASLTANTLPGVNGIFCQASSGNVFYNGSNVGNCSTGALAAGTSLEVAADLTHRKVWFRDSNDSAGVWNGSGSNNPVTNTGGITISTTGCLYITFYENSSAGQTAVAFINAGGNLPFTGSIPTGFKSWQANAPGLCLVAGAATPNVWVAQ